jgi:hypothetical protein
MTNLISCLYLHRLCMLTSVISCVLRVPLTQLNPHTCLLCGPTSFLAVIFSLCRHMQPTTALPTCHLAMCCAGADRCQSLACTCISAFLQKWSR